MSVGTKKCPYCAETIQLEAVVCRYCKRDLIPAQPKKSTSPKAKKKKNSTGQILLLIGGGILLTCCCLYGFSLIMDDSLSSQSVNEPGNSQDTPLPTIPLPTSTPDFGNKYDAAVICEEFVLKRLVAPSTADFGGYDNDTAVFYDLDSLKTLFDYETEKVLHHPGLWVVGGEVDSQNSFGAMLRSDYVCFMDYDNNTRKWYLIDILIE